MIVCKNCGREFPDGTAYCSACGRRLDEAPTERASERQVPMSRSSASRSGVKSDKRVNGGRLALIALILVVFGAAAFVLIRRTAQEQTSGIHTDRGSFEAVAASAVSLPELNGYYSLRAYSLGGKEYGEEDLRDSAYGEWYLVFNGDGTGYAYFLDNPPSPFTCTDKQLHFEDGTSLNYSYTDESVTVYSSAVMIFSLSDAHGADALDLETLADTTWFGTLRISGHSGKGSLKNGEIPVWGIIGSTDNGEQYFELYDKEAYTASDVPVLSMWGRVEGDHFIPVIGSENAWLFDLWLDATATPDFTLFYRDKCISTEYHYEHGKERCDISFTIYPDL
ncbi:MAG: zinc ribbon domain-containing protein [Oscillospiraceae bacterium]|nr:zinc ribbon domain-containing protein [Oscillospiraceae bacterium]